MIGIGGAAGALLRYLVAIIFSKVRTNKRFPFATLTVNLLGSLLIGIAYGSGDFGAGVSTGFLGALTTFSTFIYEAVESSSRNKYSAILYVIISLCGGLFMAAMGYMIVI